MLKQEESWLCRFSSPEERCPPRQRSMVGRLKEKRTLRYGSNGGKPQPWQVGVATCLECPPNTYSPTVSLWVEVEG